MGANAFNINACFIFLIYLPNLRYLKISVYKKEAKKLFIGIDKRDIKNRSKAKKKDRSIVNRNKSGRPDIAVAKNPAIVED